jgi:hypothetical protein
MRGVTMIRHAIAVLLLGWVATTPAHAITGIIVPVFDGPDRLARNVATTLYLQVWQTLRRAPWPNPRKLDFGTGIVRYSLEPMPETSPESVTRYISNSQVQLAMWGAVRPLGDGVLVQAFVAAPTELSEARADWSLRLGTSKVSLGLPRQTFDFDAVVLDRSLIDRYRSPDGLRMCAEKRLPCDASPVGGDWRAIGHEGLWANIVSNDTGRTGWLYLADLDRLPNDIADFAAGLLSYYRKDFAQAARLFGKVAARAGSASAIRSDAAVLALVARARDGEDVTASLDAASRADPTSLYVYQAAMMARLSTAIAKPVATRRVALAAIRASLNVNRELFATDDPWLRSIDTIVTMP